MGASSSGSGGATILDGHFYGPSETLAYISRRMMPAHAIVRRILGEARHLVEMQERRECSQVNVGVSAPSSSRSGSHSETHGSDIDSVAPFKVRRMLDFGCGPGTAIWAAGQVWPESLRFAHGVDTHQAMLDALHFFKTGGGGGGGHDAIGRVSEHFEAALSPSWNNVGGAIGREGGEDEAVIEEGPIRHRREKSEQEVYSNWLRALDDQASDWMPPADFQVHTSRDVVSVVEAALARDSANRTGPQERRGRYDLVTATWVLGDLTASARATKSSSLLRSTTMNAGIGEQHETISDAAAVALWGAVAPGGMLVLVENGDIEGSRRILRARDAILSKYGEPIVAEALQKSWRRRRRLQKTGRSGRGGRRADADGDGSSVSEPATTFASVVAPCTHSLACPFGALSAPPPSSKGGGASSTAASGSSDDGHRITGRENWCRFVQRVPLDYKRSKAQPHGDEKFSYVVIRKRELMVAGQFSGDVGSSNSSANRRESSTSAAATEEELLLPGGRILRSPIKKKGHVIVDVCRAPAAASRPTAKVRQGSDGSAAVEGEANANPESASSARLDRAVVSRAKYPALYMAARKASWGGLWPGSEEPYFRCERPEPQHEEEMARWMASLREAGWNVDGISLSSGGDTVQDSSQHHDMHDIFLGEDGGIGVDDDDDDDDDEISDFLQGLQEREDLDFDYPEHGVDHGDSDLDEETEEEQFVAFDDDSSLLRDHVDDSWEAVDAKLDELVKRATETTLRDAKK